ncbi:MAG TPA: TetR/AcrR family transcriptional regulator, partial [Bacteroidales bacterium]|nr:TetR/AcrR family transcriptional regulator [Bacteroidales bacterium]
NKALLHYYYRSKDKLFDAIFAEAFMKFLPNISQIMMSDECFEKKIRLVISHYTDMLMENPHLPLFIMHEIQRKPDMIVKILRSSGINPAVVAVQLQKEAKEGKIRDIALPHLMTNIIGMCILPFIGRPILEGLLFNGNKKAYDHFLQQRKNLVADFIINAVSK